MSCGCNQLPEECNTGCPKIVDAKCVYYNKSDLTCLEISANTPLQTIIKSIDTRLCTLVIDWADFEYSCLTPATTAQEFVETISEFVCDLSEDIVDIQEDITNIQDDITTIQGDITTIEGDITTIEGDIVILQAATAIETWKTFGDPGDMANGQPIPALTAGTAPVAGTGVARLRADGDTHVEINLSVETSVADTIQLELLTTLPTGYRPQVLYQFPITCTEVGDPTSLWHGEVHIANTGTVTLYIWDVIPPGDVDLVVNFFERFAID